ncbi:MAG: SDR family NAD(P)-dependent oxidoreductase, partial [Frankiales bacterium]
MDLGLGGKVYVVTGASRGLGLAAATVLAAEGAYVVLAARDATSVAAAADRLGAVGVAADLADAATPDRLIAAALEAYGRLDGALVSVGQAQGRPGRRPADAD